MFSSNPEKISSPSIPLLQSGFLFQVQSSPDRSRNLFPLPSTPCQVQFWCERVRRHRRHRELPVLTRYRSAWRHHRAGGILRQCLALFDRHYVNPSTDNLFPDNLSPTSRPLILQDDNSSPLLLLCYWSRGWIVWGPVVGDELLWYELSGDFLCCKLLC